MKKSFVVAGVLAAVLALGGCGGSESGASSEQMRKADRLSEIAQKTGGDWNKLSSDDRNYLVNDISGGNEASARRLLFAKSEKGKPNIRKGPAGAPRK